jgi:hypothetical protein
MELLCHDLYLAPHHRLDYIMSESHKNPPSDPNVSDRQGTTPLHLAARYNSTDALRSLMKHGADVNVKDNRGKSPIHLAARRKFHGTVAVSYRPELGGVNCLIAGERVADKVHISAVLLTLN